MLNLPVNVSSAALIALCRRQGALYLDICIEPWEGGYIALNADLRIAFGDVDATQGCQPAELGWGTHERHFPPDGARHVAGSRASMDLEMYGQLPYSHRSQSANATAPTQARQPC